MGILCRGGLWGVAHEGRVLAIPAKEEGVLGIWAKGKQLLGFLQKGWILGDFLKIMMFARGVPDAGGLR